MCDVCYWEELIQGYILSLNEVKKKVLYPAKKSHSEKQHILEQTCLFDAPYFSGINTQGCQIKAGLH
jgi:hypothetical protein